MRKYAFEITIGIPMGVPTKRLTKLSYSVSTLYGVYTFTDFYTGEKFSVAIDRLTDIEPLFK